MSSSLLILAVVVTLGWTTGPGRAAADTASVLPAGTLLAQAPAPQPSQPTLQQRVAMLKQWLQTSGRQLRSYEWVETTIVSQGGVEKLRRQEQVYYGADGRLQKVQLSETKPDSGGGPPGVRPFGRLARRAAEHQKEELTAYIKSAVQLAHDYVPPQDARVQQAVDAGKLAVNLVQPGRQVRLDVRDYLKPGDVLGVEIELPTNRLVGLSVASYLDEPSEAVDVKVDMSMLPDGTLFPGQIVLDAKAEDIRVAIQNSGHRRVAR